MENGNGILMNSFLKHIKHLHSKELLLSSVESQRFTSILCQRPREQGPPLPFDAHRGEHLILTIVCSIVRWLFSFALEFINQTTSPRWRCFIKGVSTTHVIMTILPASEKDVQLLVLPPEYFSKDFASDVSDWDSESGFVPTIENPSSPTTKSRYRTLSNVYNSKEGLIIPVYVYDCSLALLMDALISKLKSSRSKDIYQDHIFKFGPEDRQDFINLRNNGCNKPSSPEPKSEDSDNVGNGECLFSFSFFNSISNVHISIVYFRSKKSCRTL